MQRRRSLASQTRHRLINVIHRPFRRSCGICTSTTEGGDCRWLAEPGVFRGIKPTRPNWRRAKTSKEMSMSASIKPYRISVSDDVLDDLKSRLRNTRWPEAELVDDWSQGAPLKWIRDICGYWADDYDWRAREARLNRFAQFTTAIDGLDIHFLHVRSKHPDAMPLIIPHRSPGSVVEFHKVIEPLTDPTEHSPHPPAAVHS